MGSITLAFDNEINESLQVNDTVYYYNNTNTLKLGTCTSISTDRKSLVCNVANHTPRPTVGASGNLILFSKDNLVNTSSIRGHYAEIEFKNSSSSKVELFSVGSEVYLSSK
tara:strand:- start:410 stop:742 length:333 start_codon:yes stop_codon:yes gene_type:complete